MPEISDAWLALIGAILGGSGLKVVDTWLSKAKVKDDSASKFRDELRAEVSALRDDLREAVEEKDKWQEKYYELLVEKRGEKDAGV